MFALPALLSLRLGFVPSVVFGAGAASPRALAHLSRWASFMRCRAAAENFLRLCGNASGVPAFSLEAPGSMALVGNLGVDMLLLCLEAVDSGCDDF